MRPLATLRRHWPWLVPTAVLWAILAVLLLIALRRNQGHVVYAIDDAYIHMAMARTLADHGVWGLSRHGYANASSSPLWTALLALGYLASGVNEVLPLAGNAAAATLLLLVAYRILAGLGSPPGLTLGALLAVLFVTPLPALVFAGMEHLLQALLVLAFAAAGARALTAAPGHGARAPAGLFALAPLVTTVRYEGVFVVGAVGLLLVVRRRRGQGLALWALGALPLAALGAWSVSHGWYLVPSGVLLKAEVPGFGGAGEAFAALTHGLVRLVSTPGLFCLALGALILLRLGRQSEAEPARRARALLAIFLLTLCPHVQFAGLGWFFRYEAYLLALGLVSVAAAVAALAASAPARPRPIWRLSPGLAPRLSLAAIVVLVGTPFVQRAARSLDITVRATGNIYRQQFQMGRFLDRFYRDQPVAVNDIGAVSFLADVRLLDVSGLGDAEVLRLLLGRRRGTAPTRPLDRLLAERGVSVAVAYDYAFYPLGGLPAGWVEVGQWRIDDNVVCGGDTVHFFAAGPDAAARLTASLRAFSPFLPPGVAEGGRYRQDEGAPTPP